MIKLNIVKLFDTSSYTVHTIFQVKAHHYIENKDGDGVPYHIVAQRAWDLYKKKNDSIIVDLFQAMILLMLCDIK